MPVTRWLRCGRGGRQHDGALEGLAADGAVADELGARLAHGAVAAGPRHHHPRLRHADHALALRTLLGRRERVARTNKRHHQQQRVLAPRNALQPRDEGREAGALLRPLRPARTHDPLHGVGAPGRLVEALAAALVRRHRLVALQQVVGCYKVPGVDSFTTGGRVPNTKLCAWEEDSGHVL